MDKLTVKNNKREFDFWLEDGEVLYRYINSEHHAETGWQKMPDGVNFFSPKCHYVINDDAVEFRKAIVDGKKIEFFDIKEEHPTDKSKDVYDWKVLNICKKDFYFNDDLTQYRVAK